MRLPCTVCGTILSIKPDTEFIYCTMCGTRIELGMHSYRTESDSKPRLYCINCDQNLDPNITGRIYSCSSCAGNICNICAKLSDNKHYCPKCFLELPKKKK